MKYNIIQKFGFAIKGFGTAFKEEAHLRFHTFSTAIVITAGFYFGIKTSEWLVLLICISGVLSLELVNSAIENLVDLKSPEADPIAGKVKDMAAGAVLVSALISAVIGTVIFWPHICPIIA